MNKKIFSVHSLRNLLAVVFVIGLGYVAYTVSPNTVVPTKAVAGVSQNVTGWAWSLGTKTGVEPFDNPVGPYSNTAGNSSGLGWISLNGNDCDNNGTIYLGTPANCPVNGTAFKDYGVNISPVATTGTGDFSGNAWSENIGWVSFNRSETGTPPFAPFNGASGTIAQVDWTTGKVTGWARVLSGCEITAGIPATGCVPTPGTTAGANSGGWDGWIKLSDDTIAVWNGLGVKIDTATGKFSGKAWGGDVIGWVDFAPLINGTTPLTAPAKVAVPCTASNPTFTASGTCDATASCVSGGSVTQTNLTGVQSGTCSDGSTGVAYTTCTAPTTTCTAGTGTAGINSWFVGDGSCIAGTGENSTNSLADCKPKTKFWQF